MKVDDGSGPNGSVIHYSQTGFSPAEPRELPIGDYDTCKISKRSPKPGALSCSKHVAGAYLIASRFCCFNSGGLSWTLQAMDDYSISTACGFHKNTSFTDPDGEKASSLHLFPPTTTARLYKAPSAFIQIKKKLK